MSLRTSFWLALALVMAVAPTAWASHDTMIVSAPPALTNSSTADFDFETNSTSSFFYQCSLDSAPFAHCTDPYQITNVPEGSHTLAVRAVAGDASSHPDPTPATHTWTVDLTPPDTTITSGPSGPTTDPTFEFSSSESGGGFECAIDGGAFAGCGSPHTVTGVAQGAHTLRVRARDAAGNADGTPAERTFTLAGPPTPTIQIVPAPTRSRSRGRRPGRRLGRGTNSVQTQANWLVKWDAFSAESFDVSYRKIPTGRHPDTVAATAWRDDVTSKQALFTAASGFTYCFEVVAANSAGVASAPAEVCTAMPHRAKKLARHPFWRLKTFSGYYLNGHLRWDPSAATGPVPPGGTIRAALTGPVDGAPAPTCTIEEQVSPCPESLTYNPDFGGGQTFCEDGECHEVEWPDEPYLKRIVLVATRCPSCGKVRVTVQGSPLAGFEPLRLGPTTFQKEVDLSASTMKKRQVFTIRTYANPDAFPGWLVRIKRLSGSPRIEGLALTSER